MTDLPFDYPGEAPPSMTGAAGRRCRRHDWQPTDERRWSAADAPSTLWRCTRCGKARDDTRSRRGRNNRARGNAIEREMARALGLRKVGHYGGAEDLVSEPFVAQVKSRSGAAFPGWMDDEIGRLPVAASQTPLLVVAEAGTPGRRRRALVVLRLDDWVALHGLTPEADR